MQCFVCRGTTGEIVTCRLVWDNERGYIDVPAHWSCAKNHNSMWDVGLGATEP